MSLDTCHLFNLTRLYIYIYIYSNFVYIYMWKQSLASGPIVLVDVRFLSSQVSIRHIQIEWRMDP